MTTGQRWRLEHARFSCVHPLVRERADAKDHSELRQESEGTVITTTRCRSLALADTKRTQTQQQQRRRTKRDAAHRKKTNVLTHRLESANLKCCQTGGRTNISKLKKRLRENREEGGKHSATRFATKVHWLLERY